MNEERAQVNREIGEAHRELRRHMPDEWADLCSVCDTHGKCAEYHRLLARLHVLEELEYELAEVEDCESEGDSVRVEAARATIAAHRARLTELATPASATAAAA